MQCPNGCSVSMEEKILEKIFYRQDEPLVISDLLIYVCPECLQETMPLATAKKVEDILNGKRNSSGKFVAELY